MVNFPVSDLSAPAARFGGGVAFRDSRDHARAYEQAWLEFTAAVKAGEDIEGAAILLNEALAPLGFDADEVRWHVENVGARMPTAYAHAADLLD